MSKDKLDDNTKAFLRGLTDLMLEHSVYLGCDIDEGGNTEGIFVEAVKNEPGAPRNGYHTLVRGTSYLHAVDIAEVLLDDKDMP